MIREHLRCVIAEIKSAVIVGEANDQESALRRIPVAGADIVVLNIMLAEGRGIDVLRGIKESMPATKVMILTNHVYPQYRQECLSLGADCFLDMSKDLSRMAGILRDWIGKRSPEF